jgi:hypothetical protein
MPPARQGADQSTRVSRMRPRLMACTPQAAARCAVGHRPPDKLAHRSDQGINFCRRSSSARRWNDRGQHRRRRFGGGSLGNYSGPERDIGNDDHRVVDGSAGVSPGDQAALAAMALSATWRLPAGRGVPGAGRAATSRRISSRWDRARDTRLRPCRSGISGNPGGLLVGQATGSTRMSTSRCSSLFLAEGAANRGAGLASWVGGTVGTMARYRPAIERAQSFSVGHHSAGCAGS